MILGDRVMGMHLECEVRGVIDEIKVPGPLNSQRTHRVKLDQPVRDIAYLWFNPSDLSDVEDDAL